MPSMPDTLKNVRCFVSGCPSFLRLWVLRKDTVCLTHDPLTYAQCDCKPKLEFFRFPQTRYDKMAWVKLIKQCSDEDTVKWKPPRFAGVCQHHFVDGHPSGDYPFPTLGLGYDVTENTLIRLKKMCGRLPISYPSNMRDLSRTTSPSEMPGPSWTSCPSKMPIPSRTGPREIPVSVPDEAVELSVCDVFAPLFANDSSASAESFGAGPSMTVSKSDDSDTEEPPAKFMRVTPGASTGVSRSFNTVGQESLVWNSESEKAVSTIVSTVPSENIVQNENPVAPIPDKKTVLLAFPILKDQLVPNTQPQSTNSGFETRDKVVNSSTTSSILNSVAASTATGFGSPSLGVRTTCATQTSVAPANTATGFASLSLGVGSTGATQTLVAPANTAAGFGSLSLGVGTTGATQTYVSTSTAVVSSQPAVVSKSPPPPCENCKLLKRKNNKLKRVMNMLKEANSRLASARKMSLDSLDDKQILYYTGLPGRKGFTAVFDYLRSRPKQGQSLTHRTIHNTKDALLMTLMHYHSNITIRDLAYRFGLGLRQVYLRVGYWQDILKREGEAFLQVAPIANSNTSIEPRPEDSQDE